MRAVRATAALVLLLGARVRKALQQVDDVAVVAAAAVDAQPHAVRLISLVRRREGGNFLVEAGEGDALRHDVAKFVGLQNLPRKKEEGERQKRGGGREKIKFRTEANFAEEKRDFFSGALCLP